MKTYFFSHSLATCRGSLLQRTAPASHCWCSPAQHSNCGLPHNLPCCWGRGWWNALTSWICIQNGSSNILFKFLVTEAFLTFSSLSWCSASSLSQLSLWEKTFLQMKTIEIIIQSNQQFHLDCTLRWKVFSSRGLATTFSSMVEIFRWVAESW